jgi:hypothetical protein
MAGRLAATSDGLGLIGTGEGCHREHRRQRNEQSEYGFTHRISW